MNSSPNRRHFLRGAGALIVLPALESIEFRRFASAAPGTSAAVASAPIRCAPIFVSGPRTGDGVECGGANMLPNSIRPFLLPGPLIGHANGYRKSINRSRSGNAKRFVTA